MGDRDIAARPKGSEGVGRCDTVGIWSFEDGEGVVRRVCFYVVAYSKAVKPLSDEANRIAE